MTDPMTAAELDAIEQRADAATEGPWIAEYGEQGHCVIPGDAQSTREAVVVTRLYRQAADAAFIAAARDDVPRLLAGVRRLQAADERVRALHRPVDIEPSDTICGECSYGLRNGRYLPPVVEYPCPTIAALDGGE